jgi:chromate transporter
MMTIPLLVVLALAAVYMQYAHLPAVAGALRGMGAVAAGLIIGTGIKLASVLRTSPLGVPACIALGAATFFAVGVMRWPLVWVLLVLGAVGIAFAWRRVTGPSSGDDANGWK